jgi:crossover junction endonuclease MUS81|tara:strand:+ start:252 stop:983 length:732 start_codon:yes stop_codon:yes gene_type:complete
MSIICKIDNRERDIIQKFDDNIVKENLDIGDIQIIYKDNNDEKLLVIIERKTYDDLSTSIKDGRYKEQKNRILNSISNNIRKIYLLEGNKNDFTLSKNVLDGTIMNTIIRDNIHIFISKNIDETIKFINNILKNIMKYKDNIINNQHNIETNNVLINTSKKSNMSSETCFINMMSGIPGISKKTSLKFIEKFKNINNMFNHFHKNLDNNRDLIISDLENMKVAENNRKLGNKNAVRIYDFLFN